MVEINDKKYKLSENNFYNIVTKKNKIILGDSGRKDNFNLIYLFNKFNGNHKQFPNYTITRKGLIYEHFSPDYFSDYFSDMNLNKSSIIICLENMGPMYYNDEVEEYYNKLNEKYIYRKKIYYKEWRNFSYFEEYSKKQQQATYDLCNFLCDKYKIVKDTLGYNVYNKYAYDYNGIISKSSLEHDFLDLNPSFNFMELDKQLKKELS